MGVKKEHLHTRAQAGLFDVSHMGQLKLIGKNAAAALETLFTNEQGGFPSADIILDQIAIKNVNRKRIGMVGLGKAPVREGAELYNSDGEKIGVVTSGTAGPTKGTPIAMGYVQTAICNMQY
jgi:glycine cleavage system aminomethyltransferase T